MTIKQAVINVCNRLNAGDKLLGYQLYDRVLLELHLAGNTNRPLSDTVLRRFREVRELCDMESHPSVSEYTKKCKIDLTDEEQRIGQQAMF